LTPRRVFGSVRGGIESLRLALFGFAAQDSGLRAEQGEPKTA